MAGSTPLFRLDKKVVPQFNKLIADQMDEVMAQRTAAKLLPVLVCAEFLMIAHRRISEQVSSGTAAGEDLNDQYVRYKEKAGMGMPRARYHATGALGRNSLKGSALGFYVSKKDRIPVRVSVANQTYKSRGKRGHTIPLPAIIGMMEVGYDTDYSYEKRVKIRKKYKTPDGGFKWRTTGTKAKTVTRHFHMPARHLMQIGFEWSAKEFAGELATEHAALVRAVKKQKVERRLSERELEKHRGAAATEIAASGVGRTSKVRMLDSDESSGEGSSSSPRLVMDDEGLNNITETSGTGTVDRDAVQAAMDEWLKKTGYDI